MDFGKVTFNYLSSIIKDLIFRKIFVYKKISSLVLNNIPSDITKWDINTLKDLSKVFSIEGETFDFKDKRDIKNEIQKDFCAFANSSGGIIVFGVEEKKENGHTIEFKLNGWPDGNQDIV